MQNRIVLSKYIALVVCFFYLIAVLPVSANNTGDYTLIVRLKTGNEPFAGTNADVYFGFVTTDNKEYESKALGSSTKDDFEAGSDQEYYIKIDESKYPRDSIQTVRIRKAGAEASHSTGSGAFESIITGIIDTAASASDDAWVLERVEVKVKETGRILYTNKINVTLSAEKGYKNTWADKALDCEKYIEEAFITNLGRAPYDTEYKTYTQNVYNRVWTYNDVLINIRNTKEFENRVRNLTGRFYRELLWRRPASGELDTLVLSARREGFNEKSVWENIKASAEYKSISTLKTRIKDAYLAVLNRATNNDDFSLGSPQYYMGLLRVSESKITTVHEDLLWHKDIEKMYQRCLGRLPKEYELLEQLTLLRKGGTMENVEASLTRYPEYWVIKEQLYQEKTKIDSEKLTGPKVLHCEPGYPRILYEGYLNLEGYNLFVEGDLIIMGGKVSLNRGLLTVNGTLTLSGGEIDVSGGAITASEVMHSKGKLKLSGGRVDVKNDYKLTASACRTAYYSSYSGGEGLLEMTNDADYLKVGGSFVTTSSVSHSNFLKAGTIEIKGDFIQGLNSGYMEKTEKYHEIDDGSSSTSVNGTIDDSAYNFKASGTHKVVLTGSKEQHIYFETPFIKTVVSGAQKPIGEQAGAIKGIKVTATGSKDIVPEQYYSNSMSMFNILESRNTEGIKFLSGVNVYTLFNHNGNRFTFSYDRGLRNGAYENCVEGFFFSDYDRDEIKDDEDKNPLVPDKKPYPAMLLPAPASLVSDTDIPVRLEFNQEVEGISFKEISITDKAGSKVKNVIAGLDADKKTLVVSHGLLEAGKEYAVLIPSNTIRAVSTKLYNDDISWEFAVGKTDEVTVPVPDVNAIKDVVSKGHSILLSAEVRNGIVYLSWQQPVDYSQVEGYYLYRGIENNKFDFLQSLNKEILKSTAYEDDQCKAGSTYYYICTIKYKDGKETLVSNEIEVKLPGSKNGTSGINNLGVFEFVDGAIRLEAKRNSPGVMLSWHTLMDVQSIKGYNIYRSAAANEDSETPLNTELITGTSFSDTSAIAGKTYYYTCGIVLQDGSEFIISNVAIVPAD